MGNRNLLLDNVGLYVCLNGEIFEAQYYLDMINDDDCWNRGISYEVVRIFRGTPMFLEDHCARLNASLAEMSLRKPIGRDQIDKPLSSLLRANENYDCNVKVWAAFDESDGINLFFNINRSFYPPPEYYENGVPTGLYAYSRDNPNVKRYVSGFSERVQALIDSGGVFELLLYDESQRLTEGSKSNLFFSRGEKLYTAPDRIVLKGTVRKYVYVAAERAGIEIVERPVTLEEIGLSPGSLERRRAGEETASGRKKQLTIVKKPASRRKTVAFPTPGPWPGTETAPNLPVLSVNGAFLTGTSIGVLPIARIGGVTLGSVSDPLIKHIRAEYDKIERSYVDAHR